MPLDSGFLIEGEKNKMNNLSIKSKILLIVFVSLLCLSATSVYILKGVLNSRSEAISNLSMSEDIIKTGRNLSMSFKKSVVIAQLSWQTAKTLRKI